MLSMYFLIALNSRGSWPNELIATGIEELQRGKQIHLLLGDRHPFVGIYFVNNGTNVICFEMGYAE